MHSSDAFIHPAFMMHVWSYPLIYACIMHRVYAWGYQCMMHSHAWNLLSIDAFPYPIPFDSGLIRLIPYELFPLNV